MRNTVQNLLKGEAPFCIIQKQDCEDLLLLQGVAQYYQQIKQIPRLYGAPEGFRKYDTISMVPFCQVKERGYAAHDSGEKIRTITITDQSIIPIDSLVSNIPEKEISFDRELEYDLSSVEYENIISSIVEKEIGNGEGANFVIPRSATGRINSFTTTTALSIFKTLLSSDYGTYWKFVFYDTERYFIGSTPERHLLVEDGRVKMNPISGTFRKNSLRKKRSECKEDLLRFLNDQKEVNELFMVVDEELKMMAKMCGRGGAIIGPLLKEMSQLIHTEYILSGESDKDIFDLYIESMFAATVVGSPVENACSIIKKYMNRSSRYYASGLMLVGRDEQGRDFLDSPITIRTAEIDKHGELYFSVGATLVKDSIATEELYETEAKSRALIHAITGDSRKSEPPILPRLYNDDDIAETLIRRNANLSAFWFFKQDKHALVHDVYQKMKMTIIHNGDDFAYMLGHMFNSMGLTTTIVRYDDFDPIEDSSDLVVVGPGPGNPVGQDSRKIKVLRQISTSLIEQKRKSIHICLGHQILCSVLGYKIIKKKKPLQGSQVAIDLFGKDELVGFYNTFVPRYEKLDRQHDVSVLGDELVAIKAGSFIGYQFHPESILTKNGYSILEETIKVLFEQ